MHLVTTNAINAIDAINAINDGSGDHRSRHRRRALARVLALTLVALAAGGLAPATSAKKNDPNVTLKFIPQQSVAPAEVELTGEMRSVPVAIRVADARGGQDPAAIGRRTNDDDEVFELRATNDIVEHVGGVLRETASDWGVAVDGDAGRVLEVSVVGFEVQETNQAVGASYNARVRFELVLQDDGGRPVWSGTSSGDATRYGRKFSNANVNEVLSDALLEAFAAGLSSPKLHQAWTVEGLPPDSRLSRAPEPRAESRWEPISPARLLSEVKRLMTEGLSSATVEAYVQQQTLSANLNADDLTAWKEAGVHESVIRAALELPVR